jgi:CRP/FNR family transcriptional regulator, cyclic AMP receptor protein
MRRFSENTKADTLARAPLFHGLSRKHLIELAKVTDDLDVDAGRVLCREGQRGREFFVIIDGEAEVSRDGEALATLGPGDFFGEIALIDHVPRTATVTARTALRFFVLTSQAFWGLLDRSPDVERTILRALAKRLIAQSGPSPVG